MNRRMNRLAARYRRHVEAGPFEFREIPRADWPAHAMKAVDLHPLRCWLSSMYVVTEYEVTSVWRRLTVRRNDTKASMQWSELQRIKGLTVGDISAIQVFPPTDEIVDVANLYHLWFRVDGIDAAPYEADLRARR